jgi:hypothetical protein
MDAQRLFKSTPRASAREDGQENCARRTSLFSEKLLARNKRAAAPERVIFAG